MSGVKKPTLKGMSNTGYLGHFAKDKHIQRGHNDSPNQPPSIREGKFRSDGTQNYYGKANDGTIIIGASDPDTRDAIEQRNKKKSDDSDE